LDIDIRFWRKGDTEVVNNLYNDPSVRHFQTKGGYEPRTARQWEWEFASPNGGRPPPYAVATRRGRLIGFQAYIPIELLCDGELILSGKDEDTLIHPDYRGMGLLDEMYGILFERARRDEVAMFWGFTSTAVAPLIRNGYRSIGRFTSMRANLGSARGGGRAASKPPRRLTVKEMVRPDSQCDEFSVLFGRQVGGVMLHLSARFLAWRVFENPFRRYKAFGAYEGDRLVGVSVFKVDARDGVGYVSDLAAVSTAGLETEEVLRAMLASGVREIRAAGLSVAEARPSGEHPFNRLVRSVLGSQGFAPVPPEQATEFLVRPIAGDGSRFFEMNCWRISELMREY
jgi:GNAT superfamily N-acetyltransferase